MQSNNFKQELSYEGLFGEARLEWGNKYPDRLMLDVWREDRGYLLWAISDRCEKPPPPEKRTLIEIAALLADGDTKGAALRFEEFLMWSQLALDGEGLEDLPRPTPKECLEIISNCSLLAGHADLDGIYSLAIALQLGGALERGRMKGAFSKLRLLRYGIRDLSDYTQTLAAASEDTLVIIDFAAHPRADLNLDHHATCLSFWQIGTPIPRGIYEPSMPSCPRLLATFCGLNVPEEILSGCDLIDGALYTDVAQAYDFRNPFVALEAVLSLDTSDPILKKTVLTLAENNLDPYSILHTPIWEARLKLLVLELEEQRSYWSKKSRFLPGHQTLAILDARQAPYSSTRFRYLPFELSEAREKPYLVTIRSSSGTHTNLGISRNPFYGDKSFFLRNSVSLGSLAKRLGKGGGRREASSLTVKNTELPVTLEKLKSSLAVIEAAGGL